MSEYLTRGFRAQLTTSMDSVLRRAVFEIMMIFENSVHDHQKELAQKGEEIAHLKIKLQTAEIKLKESECGGDREAAMSKCTINETQREPVDVLTAPGQTSDVPEIDFEVPYDWCAPLGCETVTKQEESVCPSVRLRKLSIPLWPIPIIKQEVVDRDIDDSRQQTKGLRRSRRGSSLNEGHKHMQDRTLPMRGRGTRRPPMRNDMRQLLQDIKQEYTDLTGNTGLRGRDRNVTGKEQENTTKSKKEKRKTAATESREKETVKNGGEKRYSCKFCKKVFDTQFGRSVHVRSHKKCRGCKKEYRFPSALQLHKQTCKKLKQLLAKQAQSTNPPKLESCDEENPTAPSKKQLIDEKESTPFSSNISESSIQKDGSTKKHSCVYCNKMFHRRSKLKEHVRVHTGERPFPCDMCSKKFRVNQALKKHMRIHKDQMNSSETNENAASTKPLEETEDDQEDLISPKKDTSLAINHNNVQRDCSSDTRPSSGWQTMGRRCSDGFICLLCQKVSKSKFRLIEHFRTHTGEKPIKCELCPAVFRFRGQLSLHKKKCRQPMEGTQCAKCEKIFPSQAKYNKHVSKCRQDLPILCKVCGKGFFYKGRLENHMERYHT